MTLLITCSGSKRIGGIGDFHPNTSIVNALTPQTRRNLVEARRILVQLQGFPMGPDIDPDFDGDHNLDFMPAFERYNGPHSPLYRKANITAEDARAEFGEHILIISALYGVLDSMDLIRNYNLTMGQRIQQNNDMRIFNFWRQARLGEIVREIIINLGEDRIGSEIHDLLTDSFPNRYRSALIQWPQNFTNATCIQHNFHDRGWECGKWIANYIQQARGD